MVWLHRLGQQLVEQRLGDTEGLFDQGTTFQNRLTVFVNRLFAAVDQAQWDALASFKGFA
jgi:hypothetical protein